MKTRGNALEKQAKSERRVRLPEQPGKIPSWRDVNPGVLIDTIQTVALAGGAIRLGYTRDGGAIAIGVYGDGDPYTVYVSPRDSLEDILRSVRDGFDIIGNSTPVAPKAVDKPI